MMPRSGLVLGLRLTDAEEDVFERQRPEHAQHDVDRQFEQERRAVEERHHRHRHDDVERQPHKQDQGREAAALVAAGAIDGLSIGYRTRRARKDGAGRRLDELELWEVSLVTFPMLREARVSAKHEDALAAKVRAARCLLRGEGGERDA